MKINDELKIETTIKNENEYTQKIYEEVIQNKMKKFKIFNIILISLNIVFLIGISLLIFFVFKLKKQTKEKAISLEQEELPSKEEQKNKNTIFGTYSVKSGQKFKLFNPEKLNLKEDDYYIESLEKNI